MKVQNRAEPERRAPAKKFADALQRSPAKKPPPKAKSPVPAEPAKARIPASALPVERRSAELGAARNRDQSVRFEVQLAHAHRDAAHTSRDHQDGQVRTRLETAIASLQREEPQREARARADEPRELPPTLLTEAAPISRPDGVRAEPVSRSGEVMAMVERVEAALRAGQPSLSLSLRGETAAHLEVTRTGPREVVLQLKARSGDSKRALLAQADALRAALGRRGLTVKALQIL
ncbi:MAG: hypothetical protein ACK4N5_11070 [Myxococcales bacterium]